MQRLYSNDSADPPDSPSQPLKAPSKNSSTRVNEQSLDNSASRSAALALSPTTSHRSQDPTSNAATYRYTDDSREASHETDTYPLRRYRVYKRRWFGLIQLTLLNIVVSWDWLTFAPVSYTSSRYYGVSQDAINWLSTGFLFAFVVATPACMWTLNRGPRPAIVVASVLILIGNWVRYAGTRAGEQGHFGVVVFGQVLIGLAQPFVLAAPTRYSELWFTDRGRISATALASLANPFGGALGQLIDPFWATERHEIPNMVLYVAIISSIASLPSFFIPAAPPTAPSHTASLTKPRLTLDVFTSLFRNVSFHLLFWPFTIYVAAFNATSSLLNQILRPYGLSESDAGICGALLIVVGLVSAAIMSPLVDRYKFFLPALRMLVPVIAAMYLAFVFVPSTGTVVAPYIVASVLGAASFSLVPIALEFLVDTTYPVSPEMTSTLCWAGGQLVGAVFILIMTALKGGVAGEPVHTEKRGLIFQAVFTWIVVPLPLCLGFWGTGRRKREEADRAGVLQDRDGGL